VAVESLAATVLQRMTSNRWLATGQGKWKTGKGATRKMPDGDY